MWVFANFSVFDDVWMGQQYLIKRTLTKAADIIHADK